MKISRPSQNNAKRWKKGCNTNVRAAKGVEISLQFKKRYVFQAWRIVIPNGAVRLTGCLHFASLTDAFPRSPVYSQCCNISRIYPLVKMMHFIYSIKSQ